MSDLTIFHYGEQEVRTLLIDNEPWWVLVDVCRVLDLKEPHRVAARLDEDERTLSTVIDNKGRNQKMIVVNESGLYSVILRSDKPEARAFKRWITHDVLPTIRKTGRYETSAIAEQPLQPSAETGLQRIGLIIRAAEHKAVPQNEQLRLLNIAIKDLTGTGIDFTPAPTASLSTVSLMDLPEAAGAVKKGKTKRGRGYAVQFLTLSEAADAAGASAAEFDAFATERGLKTSLLYGEWVRVNTPQGDAREFLYTKEAITEYAQGRKNKNA